MVKLATVRESRSYGPRLSCNQFEYVNAGLYILASILLIGGLAAQFSIDAKSGLAVLLVGLVLMIVVNIHDLIAQMVGIDFRFVLMKLDLQLGLVEFAVPCVQALGSSLTLLGILLVLIQEEKGQYGFWMEKHALNLLIAGPVFWVIGSIHNSCQIYERADGHVQILQKAVQIPFLMGSMLFLVGGIINIHNHWSLIHHGLGLLGKSWTWLSLVGSVLFFVGGLLNLLKVFEMQQMEGLRLEKLRGGAQERLCIEREGQVPLILEEQRRVKVKPSDKLSPRPLPTPYKDALLGGS